MKEVIALKTFTSTVHGTVLAGRHIRIGEALANTLRKAGVVAYLESCIEQVEKVFDGENRGGVFKPEPYRVGENTPETILPTPIAEELKWKFSPTESVPRKRGRPKKVQE